MRLSLTVDVSSMVIRLEEASRNLHMRLLAKQPGYNYIMFITTFKFHSRDDLTTQHALNSIS